MVEQLDERTELYRYAVTLMPPHPSRDFLELRHTSLVSEDAAKHSNQLAVLASTSVQATAEWNAEHPMLGDISANTLVSKYVVEKLIATDTTTTFKITHFVKLDYK